MEYDTRTYFTENEADDVKGFTIIDTSNGNYHIAEKWTRGDTTEWTDYSVSKERFEARVERGECEPKAELTQEQYEKVVSIIGHDAVTAEPATA